MRRIVALVVGLLAVALMAAPVALANDDTIKAAPGVQFSGVVDGVPSCQPTGAIINWGDNTPTSPGKIDPHNFAISGTHTYSGNPNSVPGTISLTGGNCAAGAPTVDNFTASVTLPANPQFRQCPPVDNDSGCQFLIVASSSGTSIQQDGNQPAVDDGGDDSLIGIVNNTSSPISSIPLGGTSGLFGFESDGLCDPGSSPIPSGCHPTGTAPGTACTNNGDCAFPAPPGQPAGYTEPGNLSGNTQNGYEGPTTWFSNISADQSSGQINFSPAIQPGQSTYFSLEEPPSASSLNASATPQGLGTAPPTVTPTSASFAGFVDPNGSATTAFFQYGLDSRYGRASGPFSHSTAPQTLGGDFATHFVTASAGGLVPNAVYHVRLVATNRNGTSFGPDVVFKTGQQAPPGSPTIGKNFNISLASGLVLAKVHGIWIPVTQLSQLAAGTLIDALHGTLNLFTATGNKGGRAAAKKPKTYSGQFGGAIFKVTQARSGSDRGLSTLSIVEGAYKGAPSLASCKRKAADGPQASAAVSSRILQTLRARATGRFRTRGRFAAGTVRGTQWKTIDRCDATGIQVITHSVLVTDFIHHRTVLVRAGHKYIAKR